MNKLKYLIIHCTATPENREVTVNELKKWHTAPPPLGRGWKKIGYSDIIHLNGYKENLNLYDENEILDPWEITPGTSGINCISRHIAYVGGISAKTGKPKDTRTPEQIETLKNYCEIFHFLHPQAMIYGHYHFAAKACPSFDVEKFLLKIGIIQFYG